METRPHWFVTIETYRKKYDLLRRDKSFPCVCIKQCPPGGRTWVNITTSPRCHIPGDRVLW